MWGGLLLVLEIEVVDLKLVALISPECRIDAYPNRSTQPHCKAAGAGSPRRAAEKLKDSDLEGEISYISHLRFSRYDRLGLALIFHHRPKYG
jgi:hypothetical protein